MKLKKQLYFKFIFAIISAAIIFFLIILLKLYIKNNTIHVSEIRYSSSNIEEIFETDNYIIEKKDIDGEKKYIVTEKNEENRSYDLNAYTYDNTKVSANKIKVDKNNNLIYFLTRNDSIEKIICKNLDTYEEKILYKSNDYSSSVELFGITIFKKYDNLIKKNDNVIRDYLIMNNLLVIVKQGYVSVFDGISEKIIIDFSIIEIANYNDYIYFTDEVGKLFYMNTEDFVLHGVDGAYSNNISAGDMGVYFLSLQDKKWYFYNVFDNMVTETDKPIIE